MPIEPPSLAQQEGAPSGLTRLEECNSGSPQRSAVPVDPGFSWATAVTEHGA